MKRISGIIGLFMVALLPVMTGLSCSSQPEIDAVLSKEFTLSVGQTALISSEGLKLKFVGVTADSRCPEGVECVQAGEVTCRVAVNYHGATSTIEITQSGNSLLSRGTLGHYGVFFRVEPYPEAGQEIAKSDYKLMMTVTN